MCYEKGANLRTQFNVVHTKYESLLNAGIHISDNAYHLLVIDFVLDEVSSDLVQVSASKVLMMQNSSKTGIPGEMSRVADWALDMEVLMQLAAEEWDHLEAERQLALRRTGNKDDETNLATVSDEEWGLSDERRQRQ